jgi:CRP-like cAMP-binding protein/Zn-dependent protease
MASNLSYVVLVVLVVAAAALVVDTASTRRRRRRPPVDVPMLLSAAVAEAHSDRGLDLWSEAAATPASGSTPVDVWRDLGQRLDPSAFRPKMAAGTEWKLFRLRWGNDYVMVANPDHDVHFELEPWVADLFPLMDGSRTVADIVVDRFNAGAGLDPEAVVSLVSSLREGRFLEPRHVDVTATLGKALDTSTTAGAKIRTFAKTLRVDWSGVDGVVRLLYRRGFKHFFRLQVAVAAAAIGLGGLAAFATVVHSHRFTLGSESPPLESFVLIFLSFLLTAAHELGHALVEIHDGRRIGSAGFMIYFGAPAFFVDSSDGMMMDRRMRILQAAAGPAAELFLAGIASLVIFFLPGWGPSKFLYRFALLNLFIIFLNLIPLLELDGYWIFSDLIQVPDLRTRSLAFVQRDLWHKLRGRTRVTLQEWGLAFYALAGVVFTVASLFISFFFWRQVFGGLVSSLWNQSTATRLLLLLLTLVLAGPLVRGAFALAQSLWRRARAVANRIRFRLETSWRVEAAQLIDALPAFEDLSEDILSDIAGRVNLRTVRRGQAVFRQGDRATAFYVVRTGEVNIETEHPDTGDIRVLSVMRRGDSFGELGLLQAIPRTATARAASETELFEVNKGTFDRLLADAIDAPQFGLTLQAMSELRELPAYAHLSSAGLSRVLGQGAWITVPPGEHIVEQGEEGDTFYTIRSGRADVIRDGRRIATLGPGDHFGEAALLHHEPRNATVTAHTPVRAFRLSREAFDALIAGAFERKLLLPPADRDMEH